MAKADKVGMMPINIRGGMRSFARGQLRARGPRQRGNGRMHFGQGKMALVPSRLLDGSGNGKLRVVFLVAVGVPKRKPSRLSPVRVHPVLGYHPRPKRKAVSWKSNGQQGDHKAATHWSTDYPH
jgi:hypothetical protein